MFCQQLSHHSSLHDECVCREVLLQSKHLQLLFISQCQNLLLSRIVLMSRV